MDNYIDNIKFKFSFFVIIFCCTEARWLMGLQYSPPYNMLGSPERQFVAMKRPSLRLQMTVG